MTLLVKEGDLLMPVIRKPNFSDITDDVPIEVFNCLVGNETDGKRKRVTLKEYIQNVGTFTDNHNDIDLFIERDSVVLTSSQCCILPVTRYKDTQFCVQLFNYQSFEDNPAVLVILVTKDGTSAQVIEKSNQKLFFNDKDDSRWFKAERLQDYREKKTGKKQDKVSSFKEMKVEEKMENCIMMIQVPLKVKPRIKTKSYGGFNECSMYDGEEMYYDEEEMYYDEEDTPMGISKGCMPMACAPQSRGDGMDMGMIALGEKDGKFVGTKDLKLERDDRFPIRCTFQYYRVTDEKFVNENDIGDIAEQLSQAGKKAVESGSLVLDNSDRKTEPTLNKPTPSDNPFTKLDERDYLLKCREDSDVTWGKETMAGFV
jgi:hypothetical protein